MATATEYWAMETCCHRTRWRAGGPLAWSMGRTNTWPRRPLDLSWTRTERAWRRSSSGPWSRPPPVKVSGEYYVEQFLLLLLFILLGYLWFNNELIDRWMVVQAGSKRRRSWSIHCVYEWMEERQWKFDVKCKIDDESYYIFILERNEERQWNYIIAKRWNFWEVIWFHWIVLVVRWINTQTRQIVQKCNIMERV